MPLQGRRDPGEKTAAQIAAQLVQHQGGDGEAQRRADYAAGSAQRRAFGQQGAQQLDAGQAQSPIQGELRPAPQHRQTLSGEHQKTAGEQGDQGEHGEVDAIGARYRRALPIRLRGRADGESRRQLRGKCFAECVGRNARLQADIDARQASGLVEGGLCAGDIHHCQGLAVLRQVHIAGDMQQRVPGAAGDRQAARCRVQGKPGQQLARGAVQENIAGPQGREAILARVELGGKARLQARGAKYVDADETDRPSVAPAVAGVGTGDGDKRRRIHLQYRAGHRHARRRQHGSEHVFIEAAEAFAPGANRQVGIAAEGA